MAKVDGIVEIQGTVKGLTFYRSKDGMLVRAKGGVSKKRIKNDPAFQRTRENGIEFGHIAKMSQLVRKSVSSLLLVAKDSRVSSRLAQTMAQVKNLDLDSARGSRNVAIGIISDEGKQLLKRFNFNQGASFETVFRGNYQLDPLTGALTLTDFNPTIHLSIPSGATHTRLSVAMSVIDLDTGVYETKHSEKTTLPLVNSTATLILTPAEVPIGNGFKFYYFLIEFSQELNGAHYPLRNNVHNMLCLIEVI
jgi:hypothetical protein